MANSLLKISNKHVLNKFIHNCIDNLTQNKEIHFDKYTSDIEWTLDDFNDAVSFVQNLLASGDFEKTEMNPNTLQCLKNCYEIRRNEIDQARIRNRLMKSDKNIIENIDWKLKWIMGSSTLSTLREPLLQVDLFAFKTNNDTVRNKINFEMNLEQVDNLIADLENIKNQL